MYGFYVHFPKTSVKDIATRNDIQLNKLNFEKFEKRNPNYLIT